VRLGFLSFDCSDIEKAARLGFDGLELSVTAFGDPRIGELDKRLVQRTREDAEAAGVEITALAYYGLAAFAPDDGELVRSYERVFEAATRLDVETVASMSGFDADLDWQGNLDLFARRFRALAPLAESRGLRLALENWMGFGGHLPFRPVNMGGSPGLWELWFELVPSPALGLEFDPSHLAWQGIDALRALREFADRVHHVHAKDVELLPDQRYRWGMNGDTFRFRIPGYGILDWAAFVSTLDEIGYDGGVAIEHEDPVYVRDRYDEGLVRGHQVLHPLVHPGTRSVGNE
jgi:sugar phosphate isomerase/epimerase